MAITGDDYGKKETGNKTVAHGFLNLEILKNKEHIPTLSEIFPEERERFLRYDKFRKMFRGEHRELFHDEIVRRLSTSQLEYVNYIICNFCKLVSLTSADYLFGEPHIYRVKSGNKNSQERLTQIVRDNKLHALNYRIGLGCSYRGDAFYKVRFENNFPIIEPVKADIVFPEFDEDNTFKPVRVKIAWIKVKDGVPYLRLEIHEKGQIRNEMYRIRRGKVAEQVPLERVYENPPPEVQETQVDDFLVVHAPNWCGDEEFWGYSDYYDIETLIDELNNRYSQVADILDKHADPKLAVPQSVFDTLVDEKGEADKKDLGLIGIPDDAKVLPQYLTWDAQLEHCFKEIEYILKALMLFTETSPDLFGLEGKGPESGRALRFRLMRTLAKVRRKAIFFDPVLKKVLYLAQALDGAFGKGPGPEEVEIEWKDGLPVDQKEQAEIENIRTGGRPTTSLISAIKRLDDVDDETAKAEIERMNEEVSERVKAVGIKPPEE